MFYTILLIAFQKKHNKLIVNTQTHTQLTSVVRVYNNLWRAAVVCIYTRGARAPGNQGVWPRWRTSGTETPRVI